jgi:hypothetical protein
MSCQIKFACILYEFLRRTKGYVEGKVPYFSRQKKFGREMRDLCEDHHCAPFANMDDLNWNAQKEPRHITYQYERKEVYFLMD